MISSNSVFNKMLISSSLLEMEDNFLHSGLFLLGSVEKRRELR